ncbi:hypothetical protein AB0B25_16165 [Nocardia sp. NPDC049190]
MRRISATDNIRLPERPVLDAESDARVDQEPLFPSFGLAGPVN